MQAAEQVSLKKQLQQLQAELYQLDIEVQRAIYDPSLTPEEFAPLNRSRSSPNMPERTFVPTCIRSWPPTGAVS